MVKKAFILAAGLGSRLGEITATKPKALVEVNGIPMLQLLIEKLKRNGLSEFVINIHHHGQEVLDFLESHNDFDVDIQISDEREELLDTGGAILKAGKFFEGDQPILIHNVDVISDIDLQLLTEYHTKNKAKATLCVRKRSSGRGLLFNDHMKLVGWMNNQTHEFKWVNKQISTYNSFAYNGIYMIQPDFVQHIPQKERFSIIDAWLVMAKENKIIGFHDTSESWFDLGTPEKIINAETHLNKNNIG